ncbi:UDP-2,4-diacetamido-2,4,6-trideoxy-beta-L-altropyranose hydrolase [Thermodesulfobacteriota bacterium]
MKQNLIIRADTSTQIGAGHAMRCLALAQAWQDAEGCATFLMSEVTPTLKTRLLSEGIEVIHLSAYPGSADDAVQTRELAQQVGAAWIVVDGYHFGADYQRIIKDANVGLLFIDDNEHAGHYYADIVLNQNIYAHELLYENKEPYTRFLRGTRYILLRREFLKWHGWKREIPHAARKVLVTMGGGDPDNVTLKVMQALQQIDIGRLEVEIVVGANNPHFLELQSAIHNPQSAIHLKKDVINMPELMSRADVAVSAGGSTCWEMAFMGLPAAVLVLAENQKDIAAGLGEAGVVINLDQYTEVSVEKAANTLARMIEDRELRKGMSLKGRELVDGMGAVRVAEILSTEFKAHLGENRLCA